MTTRIQVKVKSAEEILIRLRELLQRDQTKYIRRHTKPKGVNCKHRRWDGDKEEWTCRCGTTDPDICLCHDQFEPEFTREDLVQQFKEDVHNPQKLLREYRAEATLLWVLGQFDQEQPATDLLSKGDK